MLTLVLIYFYAYFIMPFLLIYVMVYNKEYLSFVATSAVVTSSVFGVMMFPTDQLLLTGMLRFSTYCVAILHIIYLFTFVVYKLNKQFREKYFAPLFLAQTLLSSLFESIVFFA
jgi:hypothetical protein